MTTSTAAIVEVLATIRKLSATASEEVSACLEGAIDCLDDAVTEARHQDALATCALCGEEGSTDAALADEWGDELLIKRGGKLVCADCVEEEGEDVLDEEE